MCNFGMVVGREYCIKIACSYSNQSCHCQYLKQRKRLLAYRGVLLAISYIKSEEIWTSGWEATSIEEFYQTTTLAT